MLRVQDLIFDYPTGRVLHGVSFEAAPGAIIGLVGPNGAGKTTSFYMIVGLVPSDKGSII